MELNFLEQRYLGTYSQSEKPKKVCSFRKNASRGFSRHELVTSSVNSFLPIAKQPLR